MLDRNRKKKCLATLVMTTLNYI